MISKIIIKETRELFRDRRFVIAGLLVILLLGASVFIGAKHYRTTTADFTEASTNERSTWESQGEKNPHSAAHYGTYAFKPKYPLSLIDQGLDKYTGTTLFLEGHNRNEAQFVPATDQTGLSRFGDLTPDFILLFIIPLLIILMGYNAFTKEKEGGTLELLKSQGIQNWKWALGKWTATFLPILLISTLIFGIAGLVLSNLTNYGVFSWSSLFVMYLVYLLYYMTFTCIVLFISASLKKSGVSLVLSLSVWILACFIAPKVATNLAEGMYPYPTKNELAEAISIGVKDGIDGHNPFSEQANMLREEVLKEYKVDSVEQLPFNFDGYIMQKGEEHSNLVYLKEYDFLKEQYAKQQGLYQQLAILSPFLPTRFLSMSLAHTDYETHWDFADAAEAYRMEFTAFLNNDMAKNSKTGDWGYKVNADFWKKLPPFSYEPPSLSETIQQNRNNFLISIAWLLVGFGALFFSTKKL